MAIMTNEFKPGDKARIRCRSRKGRPLNWYDYSRAETVYLEPGEVITIGEPDTDPFMRDPSSPLSLHDYYWFTHPRLSKPMIVDSWHISPVAEGRS